MVLEVNVASICASVPIFWPVLRPYLGAIFVTREFSVKHEIREMDTSSLPSRGRMGSETELNTYYHDPYVTELVDPFSSKDVGPKSRIGSATDRRKTNRWNWFRG